MSFAIARDKIRARFLAAWTTTPIAWPNTKFDPEVPGGDFPAGGAFVYFEVLGGDEEQASIGSGGGTSLFRQRGLIYAHIFVPVNSGVGDAEAHATAIAAIFRGQEFGGVLCRAPSIHGGETADDVGKWFRQSVSIPFQFDAVY